MTLSQGLWNTYTQPHGIHPNPAASLSKGWAPRLPGCGANQAREASIKAAVSNAFGFRGHNGILFLTKT